MNTTGKLKIAASVIIGGGSKSIDMGTTTSGDTVKISGGGAGIEITAGYGLSKSLEFDRASRLHCSMIEKREAHHGASLIQPQR